MERVMGTAMQPEAQPIAPGAHRPRRLAVIEIEFEPGQRHDRAACSADSHASERATSTSQRELSGRPHPRTAGYER
jgi:hypothetical protein